MKSKIYLLSLAITLFSLPIFAKTHIVKIGAISFEPETLVIKPNDTVKWIDQLGVGHTVTADPKYILTDKYDVPSVKKNPEFFNSAKSANDLMAKGVSYSHKFSKSGKYTYFCIPHQVAGMVGKIIVKK